MGSLAELSELAGRDLSGLDPHRPYVDAVVINCPECGEPAQRVPEVIDAWYDSGSMPFAQHGAPLRNEAQFERAYPAQFICEAIDQTRGWFYSLMAVGTLVFGRSAYENVVCLGLVVDEHGRKMSKHLGNVLEPMPLMAEQGADAVRWYFAAVGSPWSVRKIGHAARSPKSCARCCSRTGTRSPSSCSTPTPPRPSRRPGVLPSWPAPRRLPTGPFWTGGS